MRGSTHRRRRRLPMLILMLLIAAFTVLTVTSCGGEDETSTTATKSDVLRMAAMHELDTWDPRAAFGDEPPWLANVYEPLIWANPPDSEETFAPALAESWEVSDDGLTWIFKLRENVTFHDGEPFNAEAAKYSIEAIMDYGLGAAYLWLPVEQVNVVDEYTLELVTSYPAPMDYACSSMYSAWMFSPATKGQESEWWDEPNEAGTGPWMLDSYKPNEEITFVRYPEYWGGWKDNQFQKVVTKLVQEGSTQRQMLESGAVDCANGLSYDDIPTLEKNPNLKIDRVKSVLTDIMFMNTQRPPLDDVQVRQALSWAVPYEDIIIAAANGYATQGHGPVPVGLWPNDPDLFQYTQDLDKAKQLLADAGHADGFDLTLVFASDSAFGPKIAPLIKEAFGKIGVNVKLQGMLFNQGWAQAKGPEDKRQDLFVMMWWPGYPHGIDNLYPCFHSEDEVVFNLGYYYNEDYDALIDEAFSLEVTDPEKAFDLYQQAQEMLVEEAPAVYFFDAETVIGQLKTVKFDSQAINPNYTGVVFWYHVTR